MKKRILGMLCAFVITVSSFPQGVNAETQAQTATQPSNTTIETACELQDCKLYDDIFTAENNIRYYKVTVREMADFEFNVNSDAKGEVRILNYEGQTLTKWPLRGESIGFTYVADGKYDPTLLLSDTNGHCVCEEELLEPGTYYVEVIAVKEQFVGENMEIRFHVMGAVDDLKPCVRLKQTNAVYTGKKIATPKVKTLERSKGYYEFDKKVKYNEIIDWRTGKRVKSIKNIGRYLICNNYFSIGKNMMGAVGTSCALFTVTPQKGVLKAVKNEKKGQIQITAKKNKAAGNYQIQVSTDKKFETDVQTFNTKNTKQIVKNLNSRQKYYVRVRYYKNVSVKYIHGKSEPQPIYGKWSKTKKIVCK